MAGDSVTERLTANLTHCSKAPRAHRNDRYCRALAGCTPGAASFKLRDVDKLSLLLRSYRIDAVILPKSNSDVRLRSAIFPARRSRTCLTAEEQEEEKAASSGGE